MRTYEHMVHRLDDAMNNTEMGDELDQLGEGGWELVSVDASISFWRRPFIEGRK